MTKGVLARHHVTDMGSGERVMVLAHGFGCDQRMWRHVAPELAETHRVILFDLMGSGRSDASCWRPERYASLADYGRDVIEILDALDCGPVVFFGHSVGSAMGMLAAIARPELFEHLIMLCPNPCFVNHPPDYEGGFEREDIIDLLELMDRNMSDWANFFAPVAMKNEERPALRAELAQSLCAGDPVIVRHFAQLVFWADVRDQLPLLQVPTLILQGSDDSVAPLSVGDYMHARLPRSTLVRMAASGHCPHMSHPAETTQLVQAYLNATA
ncbi:hypothetical protein JY96_13070 [Aquabacterium sp. NJ1]|uniref:alpha/beta fold hydrolase n=1 Tax=Aquabacterium sp. NJ1 TaxID=1538295 RepID=UPI00052BCF70|nr:alpha/beta hydrolase [Aquabacterium sp. NJ1]KGM40659.1 hypothetical protein JY96_13070 [Aquabacterium sp. NJ1]